LIRQGEIVTPSERYVADILCEGETISRIDQAIAPPPGVEVIEAAGKYVFPGFIDPHVHIYLPFMGTFAKDTHTTASQAALVGGTTTFIEMICPGKTDRPLEAFELWLGKAEGHSACDFTFHMGVTRFDPESEKDFREIVQRGVASFKVFLAYKDALGVNDQELFKTLSLAKELGVITTAHCENAELIAALQQKLLAEGKTDPKYHYWSRPPYVEAEGVHHLVAFAGATGAHVYVVHTSCEGALNMAKAAAAGGLKIWVETLIQYLLCDQTDAEKPDFEGAKFVMSPPLRSKQNQDVLWKGLSSGAIATLATDHAPFDFKGQKEMGRNDFTKIPNGIPSLEDRINLYYTYGVKRGRITLQQFVDTAGVQAAKIFGLFPRKGAIQPGADADLVIYDPAYRGKISAKTHHMNLDYNAFEGMEIEGRPHVVTVRGKVAARDGEFVGDPHRGVFLRREPTHF
jgi:dihydropyrimidinase